MNLDERSFRLKSLPDGDNLITVYQGTNAAGGMAGRTGVAVWNSGILLTRLLDELNRTNPSMFRNKSIMELGCGTALASIALAKLGSGASNNSSSSSTTAVIATDSNPEVLELARRNIERNDLPKSRARAESLRWGLMDAAEYEDGADVVVGSDLTYNSGSWVALAETMATVLRPGGIVIYLTLGHSGFNVGGELGGFLSVAENSGLRLLTKDSDEWRDGIGSRSLDDILRGTINSEERAVIDANGGVRAVLLGKKRYGRKG